MTTVCSASPVAVPVAVPAAQYHVELSVPAPARHRLQLRGQHRLGRGDLLVALVLHHHAGHHQRDQHHQHRPAADAATGPARTRSCQLRLGRHLGPVPVGLRPHPVAEQVAQHQQPQQRLADPATASATSGSGSSAWPSCPVAVAGTAKVLAQPRASRRATVWPATWSFQFGDAASDRYTVWAFDTGPAKDW